MQTNWLYREDSKDAEIVDFPQTIQDAYNAWLPHSAEADENDASDAYCDVLKGIERAADAEYGGADISWNGDPTNPEGPLFGLRRAAHESATEIVHDFAETVMEDAAEYIKNEDMDVDEQDAYSVFRGCAASLFAESDKKTKNAVNLLPETLADLWTMAGGYDELWDLINE
jgi:hypothetical protein